MTTEKDVLKKWYIFCTNVKMNMHVNQEMINLLSSLSSQARWDFAVLGSSDVLLLLLVVGKGNKY
jgi:hypothetical protein